MSEAYKAAGVDIDAGNEAVARMRRHVASTRRPEVLGELGGFGGLFQLDIQRYRQPVLVSGTDGIGTKLKLAFALERYDTVGIDAVAMCVNDIVVQGAEPLFFLDYLACDQIRPEKIEQIVAGVAAGCREAGCALIGGETAEMPGLYQRHEFDIAGFAVGVVERSELVDGSRIRQGDLLLGLASSGIHANGFSLVRKLVQDAGYSWQQQLPELGEQSLGEVLLTPTRIYVSTLLALRQQVELRGMAHITGGGFIENIPRMLPPGLSADITRGSWPVPAIFTLLQRLGNLSERDLFTTFNMGIGMVLALPEADLAHAREIAAARGETLYLLGQVTAGEQQITFDGEPLP
ncbi:MAG: phosphoribosylformylglycinamidine cyclo-ligase [Enterobacteriaceae bacterium]